MIPTLIPFQVIFELSLHENVVQQCMDLVLAQSRTQAKRQWGNFMNQNLPEWKKISNVKFTALA